MTAITPTVSELMISGATVYRAPIGTTIPLKTLAYGAAWPAGWETLGLTSAPLMMKYTAEVAEAKVQQAIGVVARAKGGETRTLETKLAQAISAEAQHVASGFGGTVTNIAAAPAIPASTELIHGGNPIMPVYMWGWEGMTRDPVTFIPLPVRGIFFAGQVLPDAELEFDITKYAEGYGLVIGALEDITRTLGSRVYQYYAITASATA